ncbi:uncharacterized protein N7459_006385 [Penicillium hispanicum]|uniref:uncharacterized protein n=1 Tax=Penicillium hispanicum TaxID=1080232 RepID=UPI0025416058|nr:uncharacterized protein N7459_006385 [Penicillium hispanicum]KAJ5577421.1 hypothetical protein N7459_006385 [Penicillium hispanicum]
MRTYSNSERGGDFSHCNLSLSITKQKRSRNLVVSAIFFTSPRPLASALDPLGEETSESSESAANRYRDGTTQAGQLPRVFTVSYSVLAVLLARSKQYHGAREPQIVNGVDPGGMCT